MPATNILRNPWQGSTVGQTLRRAITRHVVIMMIIEGDLLQTATAHRRITGAVILIHTVAMDRLLRHILMIGEIQNTTIRLHPCNVQGRPRDTEMSMTGRLLGNCCLAASLWTYYLLVTTIAAALHLPQFVTPIIPEDSLQIG